MGEGIEDTSVDQHHKFRQGVSNMASITESNSHLPDASQKQASDEDIRDPPTFRYPGVARYRQRLPHQDTPFSSSTVDAGDTLDPKYPNLLLREREGSHDLGSWTNWRVPQGEAWKSVTRSPKTAHPSDEALLMPTSKSRKSQESNPYASPSKVERNDQGLEERAIWHEDPDLTPDGIRTLDEPREPQNQVTSTPLSKSRSSDQDSNIAANQANPYSGRSEVRTKTNSSRNTPVEGMGPGYEHGPENRQQPPHMRIRRMLRSQLESKPKAERTAYSTDEILHEISEAERADLLRKEAAYPDLGATEYLVNFLLKNRLKRPSQDMFSALILANADPANGSAAKVEALLEEMEDEGIELHSGLYHDVLKVLSIHPDYLLRNRMLQEMSERWITLTPDGWHYTVAGLLREQQYELALAKIDYMHREGIKIQSWLYDLTMFLLCDIEEVDTAFQVLQDCLAAGTTEVSDTLWYHMLDVASSTFNVEPTQPCPPWIALADGTCSTRSRSGSGRDA